MNATSINNIVGEVWKPILSYNSYFISNMGRIKIVKQYVDLYVDIRIKKLNKETNGYLGVDLYSNNKRTRFLVHRLVLLVFIGDPCPGFEANHKDGDKLNNALSNLEWCTHSDNERHAYKLGLITKLHMCGENNKNSNLTNEYVYAIKELLYSGDFTQEQIGYLFGVKCNTISNIFTGRTWNHVIYPY